MQKLKTYIITAIYQFDVLHFQVEAETPEEASKIIEEVGNHYYGSSSMTFIYADYPQIKDFAIEEDELDYGSRYFECEGNLYNFRLIIDKDIVPLIDVKYAHCEEGKDSILEYETKEEMQEVALRILSSLGSDYHLEEFKCRAFDYYIVKNKH